MPQIQLKVDLLLPHDSGEFGIYSERTFRRCSNATAAEFGGGHALERAPKIASVRQRLESVLSFHSPHTYFRWP